MDTVLTRPLSPASFLLGVRRQLPDGITLFNAEPVSPSAPSLQSQTRFAEYRVEVETDKQRSWLDSSLHSLISALEIPWQHFRGEEARRYDLRALIDDIWIISYEDSVAIMGMRLRCDPGGSGRPEQVIKALGLDQIPRAVHRAKLVLKSDLKL